MYARPLGRAHAHHRRLRALVPAAAALADELLAHVVPDLLGVDDHAVEIEDDASITRIGSSPPSRSSGGPVVRRARRARRGRRRACGRRPRARRSSSHSSQPTAPASSGPRAPSRISMPVPERDRRHAAREVLRELDLIGRRAARRRSRPPRAAARATPPGGDRDPDERRLERERDERGDSVRPSRSPSTVDRDDGDPDGVAAHHRAELVAARHGDDLTAAARRPCRAGRRRGTPSAARACCRSKSLSYGAERVGLPVDVGRDARADDRRAVALACARPGGCRGCRSRNRTCRCPCASGSCSRASSPGRTPS